MALRCPFRVVHQQWIQVQLFQVGCTEALHELGLLLLRLDLVLVHGLHGRDLGDVVHEHVLHAALQGHRRAGAALAAARQLHAHHLAWSESFSLDSQSWQVFKKRRNLHKRNTDRKWQATDRLNLPPSPRRTRRRRCRRRPPAPQAGSASRGAP